MERLEKLTAGMPLLVGGDRFTTVPADIADAFEPGDAVLVADTGEVLHVPDAERRAATVAVDAAVAAFDLMGTATDEQVSAFYDTFANALADDTIFVAIAEANAADVEAARQKGRSTTRLELTTRMRNDLVEGLRGWRDMPGGRCEVVETVTPDGWRVA